MDKYKTMDANTAVSRVAYKFSELCGIYPITPASPMAENIDVMASQGEVNFWNNKVKVIEMQSEAGAVATVHGALQSGVLATTFTASQGLLLMIPTLYKLAGEMQPAVIHVAARSLSTHALSIFGDHQDIYAVRSTGVGMLASSSPQVAYHMAIIAHLVAISSSMPMVHFFDGFRTSHEIDKVKLVNSKKIYDLIDKEALSKFKDQAMSVSNATTRGTNENDDIYFQHTESRNLNYKDIFDKTVAYMDKLNEIVGTDYKPFNYHGVKNPKYLIVAMGSVSDTIRETVDYLNKKDKNLGVIEVHLYRPFNGEYLNKMIPKSVKAIAVLDRTKEAGSLGEPLYLDVVASLKNRDIYVIGGRYGLSSKNTTPAMIKAVFDNLKYELKNNFTIGINDDVTNLSLKYDSNFRITDNNITELLIYGYGSDGMVSTSKDIIKIIGDNTTYYPQGYFQYDSKKSGGVTRSHIRISDSVINKPYYVDNPSLIVVSKDTYIYKYDIISLLKDGGTLILNTHLSKDKLVTSLPNKVKKLLAQKKVNLYIVDAYDLVNKLGLKNKISTCMEVCIFEIIKLLPIDKVINIMKENNETRFRHKGEKIVEINNKVVDSSVGILDKVEVSNDWLKLDTLADENLDFNDTINLLKGDTLPVSSFVDKKNGVFNGGATKYEKRKIAENLPCYLSDNCIQCNKCVFACPHGVIKSFLLNEDSEVGVASIFPKNKKFAIGISYEDCTGCGVCSNVCPGKQGKKALVMEPYDMDKFKQEEFDYLVKNNVNKEVELPVTNVKSLGFKDAKFEYSGACAGCGETAYIKNLTQLFNDNLLIVNATGCSSIYGGAVPSLPYSLPWASSLFEDNAEFAFGILEGINIKRNKVKTYMEEHILEDDNFKLWLENMDDVKITRKVRDNIDYKKHPYLLDYKDVIIKNYVFAIGGDGFAYDIGYGGLDQVLSTNSDINILVLDTEVYSNTGGQSSKSSNLGSIASFTSHGKTNYKKDLARMAMCYPHVYVASVNIGHNPEQYIKALQEVTSHKGPSLIIAYSPCIEHGIKTGMEHSLSNAYLATECGYFITFRYNPDTKKFTLDSKNVDFSKYDAYLMTENRYANLKDVNKEHAQEILNEQKNWAINRYEYYKKLDDFDNKEK